MALKTINLNYYLPATRDDADLRIIPRKKEDGNELPILYFKSKRQRNDVVDISNAKWFESVSISVEGTTEEYNNRVDWWFDNATDEYKAMISEAFGRYVDIKSAIAEARLWLKANSKTKAKRKIYINRFIWGWLKRERNRNKYAR